MEDKNLNGMQKGVNHPPTFFESLEEFKIILNNTYIPL